MFDIKSRQETILIVSATNDQQRSRSDPKRHNSRALDVAIGTIAYSNNQAFGLTSVSNEAF
jgi:hypothetical protein